MQTGNGRHVPSGKMLLSSDSSELLLQRYVPSGPLVVFFPLVHPTYTPRTRLTAAHVTYQPTSSRNPRRNLPSGVPSKD